MNFFEAQARARRHTGWLVVLFALAVLGLIVLTNFLVLAVLAYGQYGAPYFSPEYLAQQFDWGVFTGVAIVIIALVSLGSLYKTLSLSGGGASVAELLGGRLIDSGTRELAERRLINVVEEIAIAAGVPVPRVYLLDEPGINAFAAGRTPNDAVIGITRGALDTLNREELQGVIAHEFSHIFNGDMRLNIRLIGVLHGILLLGMIGYYLLRGTRYMRSSSNERGGAAIAAVLALGVGLVVIGYVGFFFGQWIKAMVSRQREYLADASAVQFTRNNQGIAGALKKIGGVSEGSLLQTPAATEYSHAYFAAGVRGFLQSLFATHPPLPTRIKRLEPGWDGEYIVPVIAAGPAPAEQVEEEKAGAGIVGAVATSAAILSAGQMIEQAGTLNEQQVQSARAVIDAIPPAVRQAAAEGFGARAVIYALLTDSRENVANEQRRLLDELADPAVIEQYTQLLAEVRALPEAERLPLLELTMPALRGLSAEQYRRFRNVVQALIAADKKVDLKEWMLQRFLMQQLDISFGLRKPAREVHGKLAAFHKELAIVLSLVAHTEYPEQYLAERAFAAGALESGVSGLEMLPREALTLKQLNHALDTLEQLKPLIKPQLLKACAACILYDGKFTTPAYELLRSIASSLDCPMPVLLTADSEHPVNPGT